MSYLPSSSGGINVLGRRGSGHHPVNNVLLVVLSMFLECPVNGKINMMMKLNFLYLEEMTRTLDLSIELVFSKPRSQISRTVPLICFRKKKRKKVN